MKNDPIVEEVREIRDALARRFDYDLHAIFENARELQKRQGHPVVSRPPKPAKRAPHVPAGK